MRVQLPSVRDQPTLSVRGQPPSVAVQSSFRVLAMCPSIGLAIGRSKFFGKKSPGLYIKDYHVANVIFRAVLNQVARTQCDA